MNKLSHFGEHVMIDGYGGDYKKLDSDKVIISCLKNLPNKLGMKIITDPQTRRVEGNGKKDPGGISGFVMIAESHMSIHTFPKRQFVSIDVYTCKNGMAIKTITNYFKKAFGLKDLEINFVKRGTHYPKNNTI